MKICIATLSNRGFKAETVKSLMELNCPHEKHVVIATQGYTISENRTYIAVQAFKNKCDYLFSVDDDQIFPADTLTRLLKHEKEIIGCDIKSRMFPLQTHVELLDTSFLSDTDKKLGKIPIPDALFECKSIGYGVILIKTEVFLKIERPWFTNKTHENGFTTMGEDYWFCQQARKAGYKIWCDPTIKIGHIGDYIY